MERILRKSESESLLWSKNNGWHSQIRIHHQQNGADVSYLRHLRRRQCPSSHRREVHTPQQAACAASRVDLRPIFDLAVAANVTNIVAVRHPVELAQSAYSVESGHLVMQHCRPPTDVVSVHCCSNDEPMCHPDRRHDAAAAVAAYAPAGATLSSPAVSLVDLCFCDRNDREMVAGISACPDWCHVLKKTDGQTHIHRTYTHIEHAGRFG